MFRVYCEDCVFCVKHGNRASCVRFPNFQSTTLDSWCGEHTVYVEGKFIRSFENSNKPLSSIEIDVLKAKQKKNRK